MKNIIINIICRWFVSLKQKTVRDTKYETFVKE